MLAPTQPLSRVDRLFRVNSRASNGIAGAFRIGPFEPAY